MKRVELYDHAIKFYGPDAQVKMLLEEMAELQVVVLKSMRDTQADSPENKAKVLDELVDVSIMVEQMKVLYGIEPKQFNTHKRFKKRRLAKRMAFTGPMSSFGLTPDELTNPHDLRTNGGRKDGGTI